MESDEIWDCCSPFRVLTDVVDVLVTFNAEHIGWSLLVAVQEPDNTIGDGGDDHESTNGETEVTSKSKVDEGEAVTIIKEWTLGLQFN